MKNRYLHFISPKLLKQRELIAWEYKGNSFGSLQHSQYFSKLASITSWKVALPTWFIFLLYYIYIFCPRNQNAYSIWKTYTKASGKCFYTPSWRSSPSSSLGHKICPQNTTVWVSSTEKKVTSRFLSPRAWEIDLEKNWTRRMMWDTGKGLGSDGVHTELQKVGRQSSFSFGLLDIWG